MYSKQIILPYELDKMELHVFADWHIGDVHCDIESIKQEIEEVKNNPKAYVVCNGDLMNTALKSSVSDLYSEEMTPMEQLTYMVDLLKPISNKILACVSGNHEARVFRNDGIDTTRLMCRELGIEDRYGREDGYNTRGR